MASNAAPDSGDDRCLAASTTDHRVFGKIRGASLLEIWLPMQTSYLAKLLGTRLSPVVLDFK
jgi:hypothetical protein